MTRWVASGVLAALAFFSSGCGSCGSDADRLPGDDVELAEVNGASITAYDVDKAIASTLADFAARSLDPQGRRKVLESLVTSRAIAQAREKELTELEAKALDKEVAVYREHLLVKQYLAKHGAPESVTDAMVRAYYDANPSTFQSGKSQQFEMIFSTRSLTEGERSALLGELQPTSVPADFAAWASALQGKGLPMAHRAGETSSAALHADLRRALETLAVGRTSPVIFVDGNAYLLRVTGEEGGQKRPFSEVRDEIRAALGPVKIRDAVERAKKKVLAEAKVAYRSTVREP